MTRGQRQAHLVVWLALAPLLVLVVVYALLSRADPASGPAQAPPAAAEGRR